MRCLTVRGVRVEEVKDTAVGMEVEFGRKTVLDIEIRRVKGTLRGS